MVQNMLENGLMISKMVLERKDGLMVQNTRGLTYKEKNTERENSFGLMDQSMKGNSKIIIFKVMGYICGQMEENM